MSDSQTAAMRKFVRDSLGFDVVRRGDTTKFVALTPKARAMGEGIERVVGQLVNVVAMFVFILAVIYLPIPIALIGMTAVWLWQRRRLRARVADV